MLEVNPSIFKLKATIFVRTCTLSCDIFMKAILVRENESRLNTKSSAQKRIY